MKRLPAPDLELVRLTFSYNENGTLTRTWHPSPRHQACVGKQVPATEISGYLQVGILGTYYPVHYIVWYLEKGTWPSDYLDHWDRGSFNNKIGNLRECTPTQNCYNSKRKRGLPGHKGIYKNSTNKTNPWIAQCQIDGINHWLGSFPTEQAAIDAYNVFAKVHQGEFFNAL